MTGIYNDSVLRRHHHRLKWFPDNIDEMRLLTMNNEWKMSTIVLNHILCHARAKPRSIDRHKIGSCILCLITSHGAKRKPHHCRNHSKIIRWFINQISFTCMLANAKQHVFWVIQCSSRSPVSVLWVGTFTLKRMSIPCTVENNSVDDFRLCKRFSL